MSNTKQSSGNQQRRRVWDAADCALLLIDYQERVFEKVFEQDRTLVELNVRTLATLAFKLNIPVILSTVGVETGVNGPTIPSLQAALPNVTPINRSSMRAYGWRRGPIRLKGRPAGRNRLTIEAPQP